MPLCPSKSDESPDTTTLSSEALLVEHELSDLDATLDRAVLEGRLRTLAMALRGSDRLRVALVREALITELKAAKIGSPCGPAPAAGWITVKWTTARWITAKWITATTANMPTTLSTVGK